MFFISSALASQTASKTTAWDSLVMLGQRLGDITKQHADHMTIDHWWVGLRVRIKPFWEIGRNVISATYHKGISTIISWKQIAARIMEKAEDKSQGKSISITLDKRNLEQQSYSHYPWPLVYFFVADYAGKLILG